ncbi:MAG TPA: ABC-2 transporter permease [Ktedonobacterales bacterium]|nr:ABC-2 transporter permease [Ktedonobacterales bacterium]
MSFIRVMALAGRIIRQFARDHRTLALLFLAPLFVMTLLQIVLNSSSGSAVLAIVPPAGLPGATVVDSIEMPDSVTLKVISANQAEPGLKDGEYDGVLIFPDDFRSQVQQGQRPELTLRLEGSNPTVAKQLSGVVKLLVNTMATAQPSAQRAAVTPTLATTYLYGGPEYTQTDAFAPLLIGVFSFFFVFLLTSVAFLRERSQGTIERLLVAPMTRTELVLGYVCGFTLFALAQSAVILLYVIFVLRVHYAGNPFVIFLVTALLTIGGVNLGIFISAFARNELQIVQFIPLVIVPQVLLGGLFFPVKTLPVVLYQLAYLMPLTYANDALQGVMLKAFGVGDILGDLAFIVGFALLMVLLAALSLRQEKV